MQENIWTLKKKGVKEVTAGEPNKGKKDECAQISLKMNKCHTDSQCSGSGSESSPEQTCTNRTKAVTLSMKVP